MEHRYCQKKLKMPIPAELAAACADVVLATDADTIGGRQARWVAAPASTGEASRLLGAAAALGLTVVPRGAVVCSTGETRPTAVISSSIPVVWTGSSSTYPAISP